uniref:Uncharacterized protein n=1 Tax=Siphoviridae sp. ctjsp22 TaxID=2825636 RepID=A0A8S5V4V9_9CAUD|nr:MAG TPA: hypothetical protein [Siphoviridae sp. ctjsp22]
MSCEPAPFKSAAGLGGQNDVVQHSGLEGVLQHHACHQLDLAGLYGTGGVHVRHIAGNDAVAGGGNAVEAVQTDTHRVDAGGAVGGSGSGRSANNVHRGSAVVVLAHVHQGDTGKGLHHLAKVVLCTLVVTGTAGAGTGLHQHIAVHHQHGGVTVDGVHQLVQLVNERVGVAIQQSRGGQVDAGGQLRRSAGQQLFQAVKGAGHITSAGSGGSAVDDQVVEVVAGRLDLLLCLERQLVYSAGGVLQHTVNGERTAHDDSLCGLLDALGLVGGVLTVDRTNSGGGGGVQLNVAVGQGGTTSARRDGVIKHQSVQQQRTAAKFVDDHLVDLVGHADLSFSKSNSHVSLSPLLVVFFVERTQQRRGLCFTSAALKRTLRVNTSASLYKCAGILGLCLFQVLVEPVQSAILHFELAVSDTRAESLFRRLGGKLHAAVGNRLVNGGLIIPLRKLCFVRFCFLVVLALQLIQLFLDFGSVTAGLFQLRDVLIPVCDLLLQGFLVRLCVLCGFLVLFDVLAVHGKDLVRLLFRQADVQQLFFLHVQLLTG